MANHSKDQNSPARPNAELTDMGGPLPRRAVDLMTAKDAAAYLQLSIDHLARLRGQRKGPGYYKRGHNVLYDLSDLQEWVYVRRLDALAASSW